jgi:Zn-dependent M28 family amino/carboxypeptidase
VRTTRSIGIGFLAAAAAISGCGQAGDADTAAAAPSHADLTTAAEPALTSITSDDLLRHITSLASDEFEGRSPGTKGEDLTVEYLQGEFRRIGLQPGNLDGTFVQNVPLVGFMQNVTATFDVNGTPWKLRGPQEFLASSRRVTPKIDVEGSDIVFVGYGVVAPEYGWDDYKDVDVTGKTIIMLVNDPAIPSAGDPAQLDTSVFKGRAMTYYGRWTYKYEIAAEKGAAAAFVVHETGPAGYPFEVLAAGWGQESFDIKAPDDNMGRVAVQAWLPVESARKLFEQSGMDFDQMKQAALTKDFRPVALPAKATVHIDNTVREVQSRNVVAKLPGGARADEFVIYSAHWDHLGRNTSIQGDQIYNGAIDNASGTAALLELAEAYTKLGAAPDRSILFLAVTAEEKGLLGAKYYAENPLYPVAKTVANINIDGMNQWGRTSDFTVIGLGNSSLDDVLREAAQAQNRTLQPDAEPEKGFYYRSDHFEFAKQGIPALYTDAGTHFVGKDEGYGQQKRDEYTENDYHKPSDEVKPDWDLSGAIEDVQLLFMVGYRVSQTPAMPTWSPGTEFKAKREQSLGATTM